MLALAGIPGALTAGLLGVALTGGLAWALPPGAGPSARRQAQPGQPARLAQ